MAEVVATTRGYFGGIVRDTGERFTIPDDVWSNKKSRPSWVEQVKFDGKGDHDGDGFVGGGKMPENAVALEDHTIPELREIAERNGVELTGLTKKADIIAAIQAGPSNVFGEAPAPVRVKNEINDATGGTEPDWVAPGGKPVAADD